MFGNGQDLCVFDKPDESYDNIIAVPDQFNPAKSQQMKFKVADIEVYRVTLIDQPSFAHQSSALANSEVKTFASAQQLKEAATIDTKDQQLNSTNPFSINPQAKTETQTLAFG